VLATLTALSREKKIEAKAIQQAINELGINPEKANPAIS
jgi:pyruvate dehydrogenase complex dehydrogenase (E1) component